MKRLGKTTLIAAGLIGLTAAPTAAAVVTNDLHLRQGPGTNYNVITAMPAGARVAVEGCTGNWCQVDWRGHEGYASASYLSGGRPVVRRAPGFYYAAPSYWGYGYHAEPGVRFGLNIGSNNDLGWRHGY